MHIHQSTVSAIREAVVRVLARYGVDGEALDREAGFDPEVIEDNDRLLSLDRSTRFWQRAVEETGRPCIGFEVGTAVVPTNLHVLGYAWLASLTLKRALLRLQRYHRVFDSAFTPQVIEKDGIVEVTVTYHELIPPPLRDGVAAMVVALCRAIDDDTFAPLAISFANEGPPCREAAENFFRCPMSYDAGVDKLDFDLTHADRLLPRGNPTMARVSDELVQDQLAALDERDVAARARSLISHHLPEGEPNRASIAQLLNLSERTFSRRLAALDTSFRDLVDDVRQHLASTYIHEPNRSVIEIAFLLGFSDPSNFARAFRRWNGQSPSDYRDALPG
jgi:AraC-like DNA-binding protein